MRRRFGSHHPTPPKWLGAFVALASVALMAGVRLGLLRSTVLPIGYGVPIVVIAYFRNRSLLWAAFAAFTLIVVFKFFSADTGAFALASPLSRTSATLMVEFDMLCVTAMGHLWISLQEAADARNLELESANSKLAAHQEEIARQNEELQSQAAELERQSEELRVTNEQLERRERTLEALLSLSRSLTMELSRPDAMTRICQTVGVLTQEDAVSAAAILQQEGTTLKVICHHGFGSDGPRETRIPLDGSFASVVLSRDRTGYLEDLSLRPDLRCLQPNSGEAFAAVLAVPLRVEGKAIGTLEAYGRHPTAWTEQHVMPMESLAVQASISLEASRLFEKAQRDNQRLETVLRTAPLPLVISNADATDVRVNPAAAALFQVSADRNVADEMGRGSWRLLQNDRELPLEQFPLPRAAREGVETRQEEFELRLADEQRKALLINARPIRDEAGKIIGAVAALTDITPQKTMQREIDVRRREAEESSFRKTRFLAAVSHDVRTPANAICLLADLMRRTAALPARAAEIPELAQELYAGAISLVNLLNDVLDIARFDSGGVETQLSEFSLTELMNEERGRLAPLARDKGLTYQWVLPGDPIWLRTDRVKLSRVLGNLVGNALKFTDRGEVRVEATHNPRGGADIRVVDTGIGIPLEHQRQIFDEFFQLRNTERDRTKGSGLGLSICSRLAQAIGATVTVKSAPGEGSTFTVTLAAQSVIDRPAVARQDCQA